MNRSRQRGPSLSSERRPSASSARPEFPHPSATSGHRGALAFGALLVIILLGARRDSAEPEIAIAWVDGQAVTVAQYQRFVLQREGLRHLDEYLDRRLLEKEARRLGVAIPYEELESRVRRRMERLRQLFGDEPEGLREALARRQVTVAEYRRRERDELLWDLIVAACLRNERVTSDQELRRRYLAVFGSSDMSSTTRYRHIFLSKQEARAGDRARSLLGRAARESFAELALRFSEDPEADRNGGYFLASRLRGDLRDRQSELEALTAEQPLTLIETDRGYHVVKLLPARRIPFEDVREILRQDILERAPTETEKSALLRRLRTEAKIELAPENRLEEYLSRQK